MQEPCCCRRPCYSDLTVTGVLAVRTVVPAVAGNLNVLAVTAVASAAAVACAAADAGIIAVGEVDAVECIKGLKEIADSPKKRSGFIDSANCFSVFLVFYTNSVNTAR